MQQRRKGIRSPVAEFRGVGHAEGYRTQERGVDEKVEGRLGVLGGPLGSESLGEQRPHVELVAQKKPLIESVLLLPGQQQPGDRGSDRRIGQLGQKGLYPRAQVSSQVAGRRGKWGRTRVPERGVLDKGFAGSPAPVDGRRTNAGPSGDRCDGRPLIPDLGQQIPRRGDCIFVFLRVTGATRRLRFGFGHHVRKVPQMLV
jgi:hypothetical protein